MIMAVGPRLKTTGEPSAEKYQVFLKQIFLILDRPCELPSTPSFAA